MWCGAFCLLVWLLQLDEWLVYDGVLQYGTSEYRLIGTFVMLDTSRDGKLQVLEVEKLIRLIFAVSEMEVSESYIMHAVREIMSFDKDVCSKLGCFGLTNLHPLYCNSHLLC